MTESSEESNTGPENMAGDIPDDELSDDELLHDTPRPRRPAEPARPAPQRSPARPTKSARSKRPVSTEQLQHIDWAFWIPVGDIGFWRPLSDFPPSTRTSIVHKFNSDYLSKQYHIDHYACMLRNREARLARDQCVGNFTYENRNKLIRRKNANGDKERTCDLCSNNGRFCARIVKVGTEIKLGFYPLPEGMRSKAKWDEIRYWAGKRKGRGKGSK